MPTKRRPVSIGSACTRLTKDYLYLSTVQEGGLSEISNAQYPKLQGLPLPIDYEGMYNFLHSIPPKS